MEKVLFEAKEQSHQAKLFWVNYNASRKLREIERIISKKELRQYVLSIIRWIDFVRPLVNNPDHSKFRIGDKRVDRDSLFLLIIVQRIKLMAFFVHAPEEQQIKLAKVMYGNLRKRFRDRLKVWELLLDDEPIVERLNLSDTKVKRLIYQDMQVASGLLKTRAGSKKFLKELCYYPILLLLRFSGLEHSKRLDLMREVLIHVEAPFFGNDCQADEERDRIRKWDDESIHWCNKLFREKP